MNLNEYNECVKLYADGLFRFSMKLNNRNKIEAEDVVQNCFEVLWINKEKVEKEKAKSYLFTVAHNKSVDIYRKSGRVLYVENLHENSLRVETTNFENKQMLQHAFESLSLIQKEMLLLKDLEGYSYQEIAEITDTNESQVKINLFRARKKLQNILVSI